MIRSFVSSCLGFYKSRTQLQLDIVYLRKQLEILTRTSSNPRPRPSDRFIFSILANLFSFWKRTSLIIKPETAIRWHQRGIKSVKALGIRPILTAYRSPWQNGYVERAIGSIRRECLDHVNIANETHLRGILRRYTGYFNAQRTHLGLSKDSPEPREVEAHGEIENVAVANGLHHYYFRIAAQETLQGQLQGGLTTLSSFQPIHYEVLSCTLD